MQRRQERDKLSLPFLSYGTWPLRGQACRTASSIALDAGFRSIDTAEAYDNERDVGQALRNSGINREDLFITSKFNSYADRISVRETLERSLQNLQLDYLDAFLIHWPCPWLGKFVDYWIQLIEFQSQGLVLSLGVSNFQPKHIIEIVDSTKIKPSFNQIQLNPFVARTGEVTAHRVLGIELQAWSPLGRGRYWQDSRAKSLASETGIPLPALLVAWHKISGNRIAVHSRNSRHIKELFEWQASRIEAEILDRLQVLDGIETNVPDSSSWGH